MINYYQILGVEEDSSVEDIKHAYKRMIRLSHPDTEGNENAIHMAQIINEAYKILSNSDKKTEYDTQLANDGNHNSTVPRSQTATREYYESSTDERTSPVYEDYTSHTEDDNQQSKNSYTQDFMEGPSKYLPSLGSFTVKNVFLYLKLSVMSLVALIKYSIYTEDKKAKTIWSVTMGLAVVALAIWGGLIGFVMVNPQTSIEWIGSSLSIIIWVLAWLLISLRSASAGANLSFRIYNYEHVKIAQNKFGKFFTNIRELTHYFISGMWILVQSAALVSFMLAITSGIWLTLSENNEFVSSAVVLVVVSWAITVVTSFMYAYKIENKR